MQGFLLARPVNIQSPIFWVTIARGIHPFPSRTRKLSLSAPIVLHARVCGRLGRRPVNFLNTKRPATCWAFVFLLVLFQPSQHTFIAKVALLEKKIEWNRPRCELSELYCHSGYPIPV